MLDIEESTSRSQYTRAKAMLENILVRKNILEKPKAQFTWVAGIKKS
jgi:RNA polymerase sigma-70 factor (ECF subfamily)